MSEPSHFGAGLFRFLAELAENNNREWFSANRERYESEVREPFLGFISDFEPLLHAISPHFVANPRPNGGSLFRIHRDTRFSKDKRPYKTAAAAHFPHERRRDVHAPGFYLHLEPGHVFAGAGLWHPDAQSLGAVRQAIAAQRSPWRRLISDRQFLGTLELHGEKLKRPPAGCDPGHPLIEDLKWKDFVAATSFSEQQACQADFLERFAAACRVAAPFTKFLTTSLGLEW